MLVRIRAAPVSVNEAYATIRGRRVKTKKARSFESCQLEIHKPIVFTKTMRLHVSIYIWKDWLTVHGKIRKTDIANYEKVLIDTLSNRLGFDDSQIWTMQMRKMTAPVQPMVEIAINEIPE
jgi:Holliday junction resolvase RusA-like endonuclease